MLIFIKNINNHWGTNLKILICVQIWLKWITWTNNTNKIPKYRDKDINKMTTSAYNIINTFNIIQSNKI